MQITKEYGISKTFYASNLKHESFDRDTYRKTMIDFILSQPAQIYHKEFPVHIRMVDNNTFEWITERINNDDDMNLEYKFKMCKSNS